MREVVRQAASNSRAIYPLGGRTMLNYGLPPTRPGIAIDLGNLTDVIDYPARDMTITVQAGIPIARLQRILAKENQRLPIDVPLAERATLGGAIATNSSGARRYACGPMRDYLIGLSFVNDEGEEVKAGGRVVKNVAGYDLCKLYTGSLGTLGIITQATLKLKPRSEASGLLILGCDDDQLADVLDRLSATTTQPCSIELLNQAAAGAIAKPGGAATVNSDLELCSHLDWSVVVGFESNSESVAWQVKQLEQELSAEAGKLKPSSVGEATAILCRLDDFPLLPDAIVTFKAILLPRAVAGFCQQARSLPAELLLAAHAGNGIVVGHFCGDLTLKQIAPMLATLQQTAAAAQGNVVLLRCPPTWKASLSVWGRPRGDVWLMRAVKERLDPRRLFNPGRFVDGL
jgi:glycolate oxidase FAD binding subunit